MRYACSKFAFSIDCYSAPFSPIGVKFVLCPFGITLYHCAKFRKKRTSGYARTAKNGGRKKKL